jgi:hypothetical protein
VKKIGFLLLVSSLFFSQAFALSYAYLKDQNGNIVEKIYYDETKTLKVLKLNTYCSYKKLTEGFTCVFPETYTDNYSVVNNSDVTISTSLGNATVDYSGGGGQVTNGNLSVPQGNNLTQAKLSTTTKPEVKNNQTTPSPVTNTPTPKKEEPKVLKQETPKTPEKVVTPVPTPVSAPTKVPANNTQVLKQTTPAPVPTTTPPVNNTSTNQNKPNVVYQVIEKAVPGPRGPAGPAGRDGKDAVSSTSQTFLSQYATGGQYIGFGAANAVNPSGDATLSTITGAGLSSCNGTTQKIVYNSSTKLFECAVDQTGGSSFSGGNISGQTITATTSLLSPLLLASTTFASTSNILNLLGTNATITNATFTNITLTNLSSDLTNGYVWRGSSTGKNEATSTLFVANTGKVGVGSTTPTEKLSVQGNLLVSGNIVAPKISSLANSGFTDTVLCIDASGNITKDTIGSCYTTASSDSRLKKDIATVTNALEKVKGLNTVTFNWIDESKGTSTQFGYIAQDILKVIPEVVKTDENGFYKVNYQALSAIYANAIKELDARVTEIFNTLTERILGVENRVDRLEKRMDEVETRLNIQHEVVDLNATTSTTTSGWTGSSGGETPTLTEPSMNLVDPNSTTTATGTQTNV